MNADTLMWIVLCLTGVGLFGYLLAVLINPEKW
ncbi:K(+)-transporting ATPase subunit F [Pseudarthrobacter equi]|nr:K(+)-transporting ATPase subunit F [Pseudarthrobacter equi]MCT9627376.1 K(+)-transporting ATPase subunit F [Pseudarthrobacter equi]